jgi:predicted acylesterase/phospholipase RssA
VTPAPAARRVCPTHLVQNHGLTVLAFAAVFLCAACHFARTGYIIEQLNGMTPSPPPAQVASGKERVARLARSHLADSYFDPDKVRTWLTVAATNVTPIVELRGCLLKPDTVPRDCAEAFLTSVTSQPAIWGLPEASMTADEADVDRLAANALGLASSLAQLQRLIPTDQLNEADLREGLVQGIERASAYLGKRLWKRETTRPATAMVLSGGAANGAFSAGFVWRVIDIDSRCRSSTCGNQRVDLVVGTSAGSLVGAAVDLYYTKGMEQNGRRLLVDKFTCSSNKTLYCVQNEWDWHLAEHLKGIVRFDGLRQTLNEYIQPPMLTNPLELVGVSVDLDSGDIRAESDQDPEDPLDVGGRIDGILASASEPFVALPLAAIGMGNGAASGTFVDGGIRSILPATEAVRRGAERVLVLSNSALDEHPVVPPQNALSVAMRSLDIVISQSTVGEVQQADLLAASRRMNEYSLCRLRLTAALKPDGTRAFAEDGAIDQSCRRRDRRVPVQALAVEPGWWGSAYVPAEIQQMWRTAWVFRPEQGVPAASWYSFRPSLMRLLFKQGVDVFNHRCGEILDLLGYPKSVSLTECAEDPKAADARLEREMRPIAQCPDAPADDCK